jgi:hypothetical protein
MDTLRSYLARPSLLIAFGIFPAFFPQLLDMVGVSVGASAEAGIVAIGFGGAALVSFSLGYTIGSIGWLLYIVAGPVLLALGMVTGPLSVGAFFGCLIIGSLLIGGDLLYTGEPTKYTQHAN